MLQKLYPSSVGAPLASSFKLIFLAEGFAGQRTLFMAACANFYDWLLKTPPFNVTRHDPAWLSVFAGFLNAGAAAVAAGTITTDPTTLAAAIAAETIRDERGAGRALSDVLPKGKGCFGLTGGLVVLLLPPDGVGAQLEHLPDQGEYHHLAVTTDPRWEQLVARTIGRLLGLVDEHDGPALAPAEAGDKAIFGFNADYLPDPPGVAAAIKWRPLLGTAAAATHPHNGTAVTFDSDPTSPDQVEFWEGAAGYQTEVYRSAKDCLMHRRLTDPSSTLRARRIPFCLACRTALLWSLASR